MRNLIRYTISSIFLFVGGFILLTAVASLCIAVSIFITTPMVGAGVFFVCFACICALIALVPIGASHLFWKSTARPGEKIPLLGVHQSTHKVFRANLWQFGLAIALILFVAGLNWPEVDKYLRLQKIEVNNGNRYY